jgi:hypothetical protein
MKTNFERHRDDGCVACGSDDTRPATVSVDQRDGVRAVICDDCGHTEIGQPTRDEGTNR